MQSVKNNFLILVLLSLVFSCQSKDNQKVDINKKQQVVVWEQEFKSEKAKEKNNEAIDYAQRGYMNKAEKLFLEADSIEPNNATILNNLGNVNSYLDKPQKAIQFFQKSLEVSDSTYFMAASNLSKEYYHYEAYQKGIEIANFLLGETNDSTLLAATRVHKALNLIGKDDCEEAKKELKIIRTYLGQVNYLQDQIDHIESLLEDCR